MAEIKSKDQSNYGWSLTWEAAGRYPIVAKRRFETLADAQAFVDDKSATASATEGIIIAVIKDTNPKNNGIYYVSKVANTDAAYGDVCDKGELVKAGSGSGSEAVANLTVSNGKVAEATSDNIGQIIFVKTGTDDYPSGPYIVTGEGTVSRLGTTTATGDLAGDVATLKSQMTSLTGTVNNKADQSDLDDLSETVEGKADQSTVTALTNTVNGKANQSDLNTLSGTVEDLSETVEGKADQSTVTALTNTVNNKAEKSSVTNALAKTEAATVDVRLDYREVMEQTQTAFEVSYEIYSEQSASLDVSSVEVLDANNAVIATVRDGGLNSLAEATYTATTPGKHDFTLRVTLNSGMTHDHKFSIDYYRDGLALGHTTSQTSGFTPMNENLVISEKGSYRNLFIGDLDYSSLSGTHLALRVPGDIVFHCLKSNGFVIPMIQSSTTEEGVYISANPINTTVVENIELVYSM